MAEKRCISCNRSLEDGSHKHLTIQMFEEAPSANAKPSSFACSQPRDLKNKDAVRNVSVHAAPNLQPMLTLAMKMNETVVNNGDTRQQATHSEPAHERQEQEHRESRGQPAKTVLLEGWRTAPDHLEGYPSTARYSKQTESKVSVGAYDKLKADDSLDYLEGKRNTYE